MSHCLRKRQVLDEEPLTIFNADENNVYASTCRDCDPAFEVTKVHLGFAPRISSPVRIDDHRSRTLKRPVFGKGMTRGNSSWDHITSPSFLVEETRSGDVDFVGR